MLPSVQNKKQKRKIFWQFVFSYWKVLLNTAGQQEFRTSVKGLIRRALGTADYDMNPPSMHLSFASNISGNTKNAAYKNKQKPINPKTKINKQTKKNQSHHLERSRMTKLHYTYSLKMPVTNLQLT